MTPKIAKPFPYKLASLSPLPKSTTSTTRRRRRESIESVVIMLARKGETRNTSRAAAHGIGRTSAAYNPSTSTSTSTASFTPSAEHAATVSEFIARFDEAARQRLQRMNEKLMQLEMQMGELEAEMTKANGISAWA